MSGRSASRDGGYPLSRLAAATLLVAGSALAWAGQGASAPASGATAHPLDLSPPPLYLVLTPEQIEALTTDDQDAPLIEEVTVRKPDYESPIPVGPFRALPWALLHPLEAWKIIMPITDD